MPDVVAIGETMVLFTPVGEGPLRYVHQFEKRVGGAETNVCIGLSRLGHRAGWISRLGNDEFGRYVHAFVRGEGVDTSRVTWDDEAPTGVYFKERLPLGGGQVYYYRRGSAASRMGPSHLDAEYLGSAKILVGTGITPALSQSCRDALWRAVEIARAAGSTFLFDPNLRLKLWPADEARRVLLQFASEADYVLPGKEEATFLTGEEDPLRAAQAILSRGPRAVVVKLGAEGALVVTRDGSERVAGFPVPRVVDPVGAGDAFAAGFIAGVLEGMSLAEAARLGNACGAFAVTVPGDVEGLPERSEIDRFVGRAASFDVVR